jgi:hypothetical protein
MYQHPFIDFPDVSCHVPPPLLAIQGGPTLCGQDLDGLAAPHVASRDIKLRLEALKEIWTLMEGARVNAEKWGVSVAGKRKRDRDEDDMERLSFSTRRTTRSQGLGNGDPANEPVRGQPALNSSMRIHMSALDPPSLTETEVYHHNLRRETSYFSHIQWRVREWLDCASS